MIRASLFVVALGVVALAGCSSSPCCTGWNFQVGKPPTITANTVLGPQMTTFAAMGMQTGPTAGEVSLYSAAPREAAPMPRVAAPPPEVLRSRAAVPECSMDEICRKLELILKAVDPKARSAPMPKEE